MLNFLGIFFFGEAGVRYYRVTGDWVSEVAKGYT